MVIADKLKLVFRAADPHQEVLTDTIHTESFWMALQEATWTQDIVYIGHRLIQRMAELSGSSHRIAKTDEL